MNEYNDYEDLGDVEFLGEEAEKINKMIEQADKEHDEVRISFRWKNKQLQILKEASELIGVPYQTYIKMVLYNQSIEDIKKSKEILNMDNGSVSKLKKKTKTHAI